MTDVSTYVARVPSQHRERPKFRATLEAVLSPITRLQELMAETPRAYDCDEAIGAQLDVVGKWVGIDRYIQSPLTGIYFEWSGQTAVTGWQSGQWKGTYDRGCQNFWVCEIIGARPPGASYEHDYSDQAQLS